MQERELFNKDWCVGFMDGDGCIRFFHRQSKSGKIYWCFSLEISQSSYNQRALKFIQKTLNIGNIYFSNKKENALKYQILKKEDFLTTIFPLFEQFPLLTRKHYDFVYFKKAFEIDQKQDMSYEEKNKLLFQLFEEKEKIKNLEQPALPFLLNLNKTKVFKEIRKGWIAGFTEAEGCFYIEKRYNTEFSHLFAITQKFDEVLMQKLAETLDMKFYNQASLNRLQIRTTKAASILSLIEYFEGALQGIKALEFQIWAETFSYKKSLSFEDLNELYSNLREIRNYRPLNPLSNKPEDLYSPLLKTLKISPAFLSKFLKAEELN